MGISQACCVHDQRSFSNEVVKDSAESKRLTVQNRSCHYPQKEDNSEPTELGLAADQSKSFFEHLQKSIPQKGKDILPEPIKSFLLQTPTDIIQKQYADGSFYIGSLSPAHQTREGTGVLHYSSGETILADWRDDWPAAHFVFVDRNGTVAVANSIEAPRHSETLEISGGASHFSPMLILGMVEGGLIFAGDVTVVTEREEYHGQLGSRLSYQGTGRLIIQDPDGSQISMSGTFKNGVLQGFGSISYSHGTVYEGALHQGLPHGKGKKRWLDKREYVGDWFMGEIQGVGEFLWPDGRRYCGSYVKNLKHGYGEYYFGDGSSYRGYWFQGLQHGEGKIVDLSGKVRSSGDWKDGVFQNQKQMDHCILLDPIYTEKDDNKPVPNHALKPKSDSNNTATTSPITKKHMKTMSSLSLCEEYLDASLEVLPSTIRNELPVPNIL